MNRRSFLRSLVAVPLGARAAAVLPMPTKPMIVGIVGGLDVATFAFWRNRGNVLQHDLVALERAMSAAFDQCRADDVFSSPVVFRYLEGSDRCPATSVHSPATLSDIVNRRIIA